MLLTKQSVRMNDLLWKPVRNISNTTLIKCYSNISLHRLVNSRQHFFHLLPPFGWNGTEVLHNQNPSWQHILMQYCSFSPFGLLYSRMTTENQKTGDSRIQLKSEELIGRGKRAREESESEPISHQEGTTEKQGVPVTKIKWQKLEFNSEQSLPYDQNILLKYQALQKESSESESEDSNSSSPSGDDSFDFQTKAEMIRSTVQQVRKWCYTDYGRKYFRKTCSGLDFTLMSYNILSQQLLEDNLSLYRHCKYQQVLEWDYRKLNLLKEIHEADPDIICLQELQEYHYTNEFRPELEKLGYDGIYKQKTGGKKDGCAIFYKKCLFRLHSYKGVEFYKNNVKILNRDNIGLIVVLQPKCVDKEADMKLCIATTHLLFNPKRGEIKLAQLRVLLAEIDKIAFKHLSKKKCHPVYHPVILCGDMNSEPYSPLYNFISRGNLECADLFSGEVSGQKEGKKKKGNIIPVEELLDPVINISRQSQFMELEIQRNQDWMEKYGDSLNAMEDIQKYYTQSGDQRGDGESTEVREEFSGNTSSKKHTEISVSSKNLKLFQLNSPENITLIHGLHIPHLESGTIDKNSPGNHKDSANYVGSKISIAEIYKSADFEQTVCTIPSESKSAVEGVSVDTAIHESFSPQLESASPKFISEKIGHNLKFLSVYDHERPDNLQEITTHHMKASCTVDYIFYNVKYAKYLSKKCKNFRRKSEGALRLIGYFNLMTEDEIKHVGGLPNAFQSSDHLCLMARFLLKLP